MHKCGKETSTFRSSYVSPVLEKYKISNIAPVHFITGEYHGRHKVNDIEKKMKQLSEKMCTTPLWTELWPVNRDVQFKEAKCYGMCIDELHKCFVRQPNQFLAHLNDEYPDVYEKMKKYPGKQTRTQGEYCKLRSTQQIDYGHISEYLNGLYESHQNEIKFPEWQLYDPCAILKSDNKPCRQSCLKSNYKPGVSIECRYIDRVSQQTGHWPEMISYLHPCKRRHCM